MDTLLEEFKSITPNQYKFLKWVLEHGNDYSKLSKGETLTLQLVLYGESFYLKYTKDILNDIRERYIDEYQRDRK